MNIDYKINTAKEEEIFTHLSSCNSNFRPPLDEKVDIQDYSNKIFNNSVRFEAWAENTLIGLVATYYNDLENHVGFITNVSVIKRFMGRGIASELMNKCISYAKKNHFREISLEVSKESKEAIYVYEKIGFQKFESKDDFLLMKLVIVN
jgi:ribosomal protein S18 acetylase RimI-like enzyme